MLFTSMQWFTVALLPWFTGESCHLISQIGHGGCPGPENFRPVPPGDVDETWLAAALVGSIVPSVSWICTGDHFGAVLQKQMYKIFKVRVKVKKLKPKTAKKAKCPKDIKLKSFRNVPQDGGNPRCGQYFVGEVVNPKRKAKGKQVKYKKQIKKQTSKKTTKTTKTTRTTKTSSKTTKTSSKRNRRSVKESSKGKKKKKKQYDMKPNKKWKKIMGNDELPRGNFLISGSMKADCPVGIWFVSPSLPKQVGDAKVTIRAWMSKPTTIRVCARSVKRSPMFITCSEEIKSSNTATRSVKLPGPINEKFEIVIEGGNFVVKQGSIFIIDKFKYESSLCGGGSS